ncbi:ChaN family lipoprotein [Flavobacterium kingsejongi]|uniref:Iron-regulated protein n=1 Tax=Flavobacterium kingsejongi TaxID=1678728 RepID=A0A2S1LKR7_9FLAO|nr:ChaN family lipoprotein [Flavobacterium kingsejongi]AWG24327.1 iron-regulated protein [Flavobacterium kingsejongi]
MKIPSLILSLFLAATHLISAQDKPAYQLFDKNGKKTTYEKMLKGASKGEVVLFGEFHDNPISHWLELELTRDLAENNKLVLGAEMFEADNQLPLDRYLKGEIDQKGLDTLARLWNNYKTDYKPLADFAKSKNIPFIATNVPRKFASLVYKKGFTALDTLFATEKSWIAPLPFPYDPKLPGYVKMLEMSGGHGGENLPKAQAVKDATMAHFILKNLQPNTIFVHYNGSFHSDYFDGINWYLLKDKPALKIVTIASVSQKNLTKLEAENLHKADYIIVVDEDMTKTF